MFTDLVHIHARPVGNGTKEILGIYLGAKLKWVRIYPSIFLKKGHVLSLDRNQLYDVSKLETILIENRQVAVKDQRLNRFIVFDNDKKMLPLRKKKFFEKWEEFCGSIVRLYYLVFPRGLFNEVC